MLQLFNQMLKSDVCLLSSEDIFLELTENLERIVHEFEHLTELSDIVECCLCMRVVSPSYFQACTEFMGYLADFSIHLFRKLIW